MELSYKIIKNDYINSSKDKILIDTQVDKIERQNTNYNDSLSIEEKKEEGQETSSFIEEYKQRVNFEIEVEKKNILENARISAELDAMNIRKEAYNEGYSEGYNKAIREAREEAKSIKEDSLNLLADAKIYRDDYIRENEKNIYVLAKAMAENIIDYAVDIKEENILLLLKPLLSNYLKEENLIITSRKETKKVLEENLGALESICPNTRFVFLEDNFIEKNSFIIEDSNSIIDLDIKTQLANMLKEISDRNE